MTTPDPTPETELDAQELTDENLDEVSGGRILDSAEANLSFEPGQIRALTDGIPANVGLL
jgi:hypothetical protein